MNNFLNTVFTIKNIIPDIANLTSVCYTVKDNSDYQLKIVKPNPFDNYLDIVAQIILLHKNKIIYNTLITINTDLTKLCEKLLQKINNKEGI